MTTHPPILQIEADLGAAADRLAYAYQRLDNLSPLMADIGGFLEGSTTYRFADKRAPDGVKWADLLPATQSQKGNNNILVASGDLARSVGYEYTHDTLTVGVAELHGRYHQTGTPTMAARPFLGLSDDDKSEISHLINDYLERIYDDQTPLAR